MMPKFYQKNGLTVYSLACGYIQRAEARVDGKDIRVDLWHEGACYHARAHDFTEQGRIEWVSEESIGDARSHWARMVKQHFGQALCEVKKDRRYRVAREFCGHTDQQWISRFCGEFIGKAETKEAALLACYTHNKLRGE